MSRRALFEVAGVLLGVYFVVEGFGSLPTLYAYLQFEELDVIPKLLLRSTPIIYLLAGLLLIFMSRTWAAWLFPSDEWWPRSSNRSLRLDQYFELGVRLLGLFFAIQYLPYAGQLGSELVVQGIDNTDLRGWLATILVSIISLFLLLKGDWLARLLLAHDEIEGFGPRSAADDEQGQNPMRMLKLVEVYRAKNVPQAVVLRQALEDEGIRVAIDNDFLQGAVGELPTGWATAPRIMVESEDAGFAREIVMRWEDAQARAAASQDDAGGTTCLACGARMPADTDRCPACGWSYAATKSDEDTV